METVLQISPPDTDHQLTISRHFFIAWQRRNASRQARWTQEASDPQSDIAPASSQLHFDSLHNKIQHLKSEIVSLIAQDMALFQQLFALQEAILELKEQFEYYPSSDESSSPYDSPCSTLSSFSSSESGSKYTKRSASFVRQHISYPPIARNRSRRIKASSPQHGCQDSYDSGIHTSDQEIFV